VKPDNNTLVYPLIKKQSDSADIKESGISALDNDIVGNVEVDPQHNIGVYAGEHFVKRTIYHHQIAGPAAP
jgi:hypothetical protein